MHVCIAYAILLSMEERKAIWLPADVHKAIKEEAQKNGRTMVGELRVKYYFKK